MTRNRKSIPLYWLILIPILAATSPHSSVDKPPFQQSHLIHISGFAGEVIDKCIDQRILGQDADHLIEPFTFKNETWCWQSEFWGKWMLSAVAAYTYTQDEKMSPSSIYQSFILL